MAANARGVLSLCIFVFVLFSDMNCSSERGPRMRILGKQSSPDTLMLPSNATSIREDITDTFSCENKTYGYYADVDNECQVFHVCLPVTYADGKNQTFRWSFICPESTVFNQENFVCVREEDMTIKCEESEDYYALNENFGNKNPEEDESAGIDNEDSNKDADLPEADNNKPVDDNSVDNEQSATNDQSAAQEDNAPQEEAKVKKDDETSRPQEDDMQKINIDKRINNRLEGNKRRKQNDRKNNN